jgi:NAD(P)-dependent dehydrogenase (short-subunit alcohol dehydrogenase family)
MRAARRLPSVLGMNSNPALDTLAPAARPPGRVAVLTGASRGLGRALARGLAAAGWRLVVDARDATALHAAVAGLPAGAVTVVPGDVTDPAHREALRQAADALGGPDLLINNAGTLGASPLPAMADYPPAGLREAFEVNVVAPLALTQLLLPALRVHGGAVLAVTSDAAVEAYAGWGGYGAAKAALEQACAVLAAEEAAVRVWRVDPGDLRTDMHQQAFPGEDIFDRPLPETVVPAFRRLIAERMPSGRYRAAELLPARPVAGAPGPGAGPPAPAEPGAEPFGDGPPARVNAGRGAP